MKKKTIAIVPAFNEEATIGYVVRKLHKYVHKVIVVSDASWDKTEIIARKNKAIVIKNKTNLGPDKSIEKGIKKVLNLKYKFFITFDADGQHPYKKIPIFLEKLRSNKADIVVGQRKEFPRFSEYLFSFYSTEKIGVPDPINGFKAIKSDIINKIGYFDKIDSLTSQILFNAHRLGCKIKNIKINVKKREDEPRIGGIIKSNYKILKGLIRIMFN